MAFKQLKVGIVGGAGYTAGELLRILIHHPNVEITSVTSTSNAGNPVAQVHDDLLGQTALTFCQDLTGDEDVVFLCLGHGNSKAFISEGKIGKSSKIIDMSNDFRLEPNAVFEGKKFTYGLPELQRESIKKSDHIANPGCFATAIQLALLPLAQAQKVHQDIHVSAITGSTGAGRSLSDTTHFSWRNNNISVYKAFTHQHLGEINQSLGQLQSGLDKKVHFIPYRGNFTRGIFASCYSHFDGSLEEAKQLYQAYYKGHPFVHISQKPIHLKQVVGTNNAILHLQQEGDQLLITSVIDNLTKGASGQGVQNMNLMFDIPETMGLQLRALQF